MLPFYLREDYMQVMVLSASAGIMEGDVQKFDIHVNSGTSMEYLSQAYEKIHKMKKEKTSRLLFQEILSCGRAACGEEFDYRYYHNHVAVQEEGKLIYLDNTRYDPKLFEMSGIGMYEGFTHLLNLAFFNIEKSEGWITAVRELLDETPDIEGGVTRIASGDAAVRILGKGSEPLLKISEKIQELN